MSTQQGVDCTLGNNNNGVRIEENAASALTVTASVASASSPAVGAKRGASSSADEPSAKKPNSSEKGAQEATTMAASKAANLRSRCCPHLATCQFQT